MSGNKETHTRRLNIKDKLNAIQCVHNGESKASVARNICVPESTMRGWCKNEEKLRQMSTELKKISEKAAQQLAINAIATAFNILKNKSN